MKKQFRLLTIACLIGGMLHLTGCKKDDVVPAPTGINLTSNSTLGSILTDNKGQTLYFFSQDANGQSSCTSGCTSTWPVFHTAGTPVLGTGLADADFGELTRADGTRQTTFKGWPLYYFAPNNDGKLEKLGEANGDGVASEWFVARPDYTIMISKEQLVGHDGKNYTSAYVEGQETSTFFTDGNGRTLYWFTNDTKDNNNFTASDFSNNSIWSVYEATLGSLPTGVNSSDFKTIAVAGHQQLVYKGHPLYQFGGTGTVAGDNVRGETRGVSFPSPGIWRVANSTFDAAPASVTLTQNATFGKILTDSKGRSLYIFAKDVNGSNHYCPTGVCSGAGIKWPAFYTDAVTLGDASLVATDFNVITLANGTKQTTYKGWPLHYFAPAGDGVIETTGATGGDNFASLWFIAKPAYSVMVANAQLVGNDGQNYIISSGVYTVGTGSSFFFVDGNARTVYRFINDHNGVNTFSTGVAAHDANFPVFNSPAANLSLPTGVSAADFAVITVFNQSQVTYKGWPLYFYINDATRGQTKGVSVGANPGVWPIVYTTTTTAP